MRVIPIADSSAPATGGCDEDTGEVRPVKLPLARRDFLKGSGLLVGSLVAGTLLAGLAPSTSWALELKKLSADDGAALMAICFVLSPTAEMYAVAFALLLKVLEAKVAGIPVAVFLLAAGILF